MTSIKGLTKEEVETRKTNGLVNYEVKVKSKSLKDIILNNVLTIFNILNISLGICILLVRSYKNLLFLSIVFINALIGIIEEIKTKRELAKLRILASNKVKTIRDGEEVEIDQNEVVLNDLLCYQAGSQILVDSKVIDGEVLVDESFITGESEPIIKTKGDELLSGGFVISGNAKAEVIRVGNDNYSAKIINQISDIDNNNNSIVIKGINRFLKFISIIIVPLGLLLFYQQYNIDHNIKSSVVNTVAALIGMIPDGLILLSSTVFMLAALRLSRKNILVQDLNCIDSLANIDTFCFDKTGTITKPEMKVNSIIALDKSLDVMDIASAYAKYSHDDNATIKALREYASPKDDYEVVSYENFSSYTKTSSITFKKQGKFVLGAKEYIDDSFDIAKYEDHYRVLLIAKEDNNHKKVIGIILIEDVLKENSSEVISKLIKKDVSVILISGDSVNYLKNVAHKVGFKKTDAIDMSKYKDDNYDELVLKYNIFSRCDPKQKLLIMKALRKNHKVAYMGDGVNDTLALKEADASISFIDAKESAKNVSKIILLNDDFNSINVLIDMGRKSVNNLTRSATLFINKTIYSTLLVLLFIFIKTEYPFKPIQLTLNNFVLIGMPSFILSLLPNNEKVTRNFFKDVLKNSLPTALIIFSNIAALVALSNFVKIGDAMSTMCFYLVTFNGFMLLLKICLPFDWFDATLSSVLLTIYLIGIIFFKDLFELINLPGYLFIYFILFALIDLCMLHIIDYMIDNKYNNKESKRKKMLNL